MPHIAKCETLGIRQATLQDVPFMISWACLTYTGFSPISVGRMLEKAVSSDKMRVLIGDGCAGAAMLYSFYYDPKVLRSQLFFLGCLAEKRAAGQTFKIVKSLTEWAKSRGAIEFRLGSEADVDFGPFARRLGAKPAAPCYVLGLSEKD